MDSKEQQFSYAPPHHALFERILRDQVRVVPCKSMILDIGSGLGHWTSLVRHCWQHNVVGLEIDAAVCGTAAGRSGSGPATPFVLYDGEEFPFGNCSFALAYAHEVIEHVQHDSLFLREVQRVLQPRGTLLLTTPNASQEPLDPSVHAAHVRHYTAAQLGDKLQEAGLVPQVLYWRMHRLCGFLDDRLTTIGRRALETREMQPGMSTWKPAEQRWRTRAMLRLYSTIEPVVRALVSVEFELLKRSIEARNIMIIATKPGAKEDAS